jgi:uncharacterized membrane protein
MSEDLNVENMGGMQPVTDDEKLWGALSWVFWPIAVLALLMEEKKSSDFIRFHAWHSIALGLVWSIITTVTVGIGCFFFLVSFYFAYRAYQGDKVTIPVITDFLKGQGWV